MERVTRCIIKNKDEKIILVKHKGKNFWVLPGGHIEKKENIYTAIKREIKEELGVNIKIIGKKLGLDVDGVKEKPLPICIYKLDAKNKKGKKENRLEYIFFAKIKDEIIKTQIDEVDEYKWFLPEEIEALEDTYGSVKGLVKIVFNK
ncbi:NUDIX domain-containing protein [Candidatus Gracilibacteria bacterium]|nr:NUDIX domain-containing protein [Candidatus Gracilibacteria bacterium]